MFTERERVTGSVAERLCLVPLLPPFFCTSPATFNPSEIFSHFVSG